MGERDIIDDVNHTEESAPHPGYSGFTWIQGLGNWFEGSHDASTQSVLSRTGEPALAYYLASEGDDDEVSSNVLWAELRHPSSRAADLRDYVGLAFWAKMGEDGGRVDLHFNTRGQADLAEEQSEGARVTFELSDQWEEYTVLFSNVELDLAEVATVDFYVKSDDMSYQFWLEELSFICAASCPK